MPFKPPKSPTSAEVARQAGVSRTTVSFVLNGMLNRGISESTRERVLAVASSMGYQPNAAARSLASGQTGTVAVVIPKAAHLYVDVFLAQLVATVNEQCHTLGLKMLIETTDDEGREPGGFVNLMRGRSIDGLIVANLRFSEHAHLDKITEAGIPLVVLTSRSHELPHVATVLSDTARAASVAMNHLIHLGHKKIAFISFAPPEYESVHERELGWQQALEQAHLPVDRRLVEYADISAQSGYDAARRLLTRGVSITALFAGNDTIAFGALRALHEQGLRVPQDVAVVGYDDIPMAAFATPPLTTMHSDPIGQAKLALGLLTAQIDAHAHTPPVQHELTPQLIVRASCGAETSRVGTAKDEQMPSPPFCPF